MSRSRSHPGRRRSSPGRPRAKIDPSAAPGLNAMQSAATGNQILAGPYVPIDIPSLDAVGLGQDASDELTKGAQKLEDVLRTRIDARTTDEAPLNQKALERLGRRGPARRRARASSQDPEEAPAADPGPTVPRARRPAAVLRGANGRGARAAARGHRAAGAARRELPCRPRDRRDRGAERRTRGRRHDAAALGPGAALPQRGAATASPATRCSAPVTLDQLFDTVPQATDDNDAPVTRELAPITVVGTHGEPPPLQQRRAATSMRSRASSARTTRAISAGNRALLISLTSIWPGALGREQSRGRLDGVDAMIGRFTNQIQTPPSGVTVTLTSRKARLPLSFNNETDQTVRVRIKFDSDKLVFAGGSEQILTLPPRNTTKRFEVETAHVGDVSADHRGHVGGRPPAPQLGALHGALHRGQRRRNLPDDRRRPVPRDLVGHPLAAQPAPARPARDRRDVR